MNPTLRYCPTCHAFLSKRAFHRRRDGSRQTVCKVCAGWVNAGKPLEARTHARVQRLRRLRLVNRRAWMLGEGMEG